MKSIFLPFFYTKTNLNLLVVKTFGYPVRYIDSKDSPLLSVYNTIFKDTPEKKSSPIVVSEQFSWNVSYCMPTTACTTVMSNQLFMYSEGLDLLKISKLDDVFNTEMPAELRLAILSTIITELGEI